MTRNAFADDVASGHLPKVSWVIAPAASSEHPPFTPAAGAELTYRYLKALADHPDVWRKTVFLLNWDENDGFFDHVVPRPRGPARAMSSSAGCPSASASECR